MTSRMLSLTSLCEGTPRMVWNWPLRACLVVAMLTSACGIKSSAPIARQQCDNAGVQLAAVLQPFETLRAKGCGTGLDAQGSDCDRLRREIERLAVICPGHAPTLMANAVLAYDDQRAADAQQFLDQILAQPQRHPDAAILRARIAIEDGNATFALRLLSDQIMLAPDQPGLHETYAGALYLVGRLSDATTELSIAGALGAPRWRIAYHLGLVDEASGRSAEAATLYDEAVAANPGFAAAESRLRALRAGRGVNP
jgi:predicted Zn-dependent protease